MRSGSGLPNGRLAKRTAVHHSVVRRRGAMQRGQFASIPQRRTLLHQDLGNEKGDGIWASVQGKYDKHVNLVTVKAGIVTI